MAERFPESDDRELREFKENTENANTKKVRGPGSLFGKAGQKAKDTFLTL